MSSGQSTQQLRALDRQHVWHPFTPMKLWLESEPLVITDARGMYLIDSDGKRYLDGVSSLWCNVHGHRVPEIDDAIRAQLDKVAHTTMLGLANEPATLLAERLMKIVPGNLKKVFYSDAGATATEIAFKLAVQYWHNVGRPERKEFVALSGAYHGDTFGAMSVGRTETFHQPFMPMLFPVHYVPPPGQTGDASLKVMREKLEAQRGRIAAICVEPLVQGAAGMIVHPAGFLRQVRELANEFDVLLICDEVATGFGRTGRMFAVEHESVQPDLMCVGKGITGGYLPLAATLATQRIFDAFLGDPSEGKTFYHGHTYTGNPLACAAALASLELFEKNKLIQHVQETSRALAEMLGGLRDHRHVGEIRQKGLMVGIELVREKSSGVRFDANRRIGHQICSKIREFGVILRPLGDVVVIMPPLAMEARDLQEIVGAVKLSLQSL